VLSIEYLPELLRINTTINVHACLNGVLVLLGWYDRTGNDDGRLSL
jgi:hypothetical protein